MNMPRDPSLRRHQYGAIRPMHWKPRKPGLAELLRLRHEADGGSHLVRDCAIVVATIAVVVFAVLAVPF